MKPISILLADEYAIEREVFRQLIALEAGLAVVGEAQNGRQAVRLAQQLGPDVVLMDIMMPGLNGLEAARQIHKALPGSKVLMIAAHSDQTRVRNAIACGAAGLLLKRSSVQDICRSIREVHHGSTIFDSAISGGDDHRQPAGSNKSVEQLSSREMEVLQMIAEGNANKQIAAELGISLKTVEKHRQLLMERLENDNTAGLTRYAIGAGIVESSVRVHELQREFRPVIPGLKLNQFSHAMKKHDRLPLEPNLCH